MDICECDCKLDQDENAARNILAITLKEVGCALLKLLDVSSKNASGDIDLYRVGPRAKNPRPKGWGLSTIQTSSVAW